MDSAPPNDDRDREQQGAALYHEHLARVNNELAVLARDNVGTTHVLERVMLELEQAYAQLEQAHDRLRQLHELLPLCTACGRLEEEGDWDRVREFAREHPDLLGATTCAACTYQGGSTTIEAGAR